MNKLMEVRDVTTSRLPPAPSALAEASRATPPDPVLTQILGPPPILASEDARTYEALQDRVRAAMAPADVIEELWVRDVVDLMWEALRLRRLKAKLMGAAKPQALSIILGGLVADARRRELVDGWVAGNRRARRAVERTLTEAGLDEATVEAVTLSERLDDLERIDRMIMQAEARRHGALREVDRHRDATARRLYGGAAEYEDADVRGIALRDGAAFT
jgi:hypothetical protein